MVTIGRRLLIAGASIIGLGAAAGILVFRARVQGDADSRAYLDTVAEDYSAGRVIAVGGWILSAAEVATFRPPDEADE